MASGESAFCLPFESEESLSELEPEERFCVLELEEFPDVAEELEPALELELERTASSGLESGASLPFSKLK